MGGFDLSTVSLKYLKKMLQSPKKVANLNPNQAANASQVVKSTLLRWALFVLAGIFAYGVGLWRGSELRASREQERQMASLSAPKLAPSLTGGGTANNPNNTGTQKSH